MRAALYTARFNTCIIQDVSMIKQSWTSLSVSPSSINQSGMGYTTKTFTLLFVSYYVQFWITNFSTSALLFFKEKTRKYSSRLAFFCQLASFGYLFPALIFQLLLHLFVTVVGSQEQASPWLFVQKSVQDCTMWSFSAWQYVAYLLVGNFQVIFFQSLNPSQN